MLTTLKTPSVTKWTWSGAGYVRKSPGEKQLAALNRRQVYKRARYYDTSTGEFISRDPLEYVDGMSLYRGYFALVGIDVAGTLVIRPDDTHSAVGQATDSEAGDVTRGYCDAAKKYPKNGWLKCACDVSSMIDIAIHLLNKRWFIFVTGIKNADKKSAWFKCTRICLSRHWRNAIANQENDEPLWDDSSEWDKVCKKKCGLNSSSKKCCKLQVEAEQTQLQSCFAGCGKWAFGNVFPIDQTGIDGDFNDLATRIEFGKKKCCGDDYYPPTISPPRPKKPYGPTSPWPIGPKY